MPITGDQIRMARAALKISIVEVSKATGIDKSTIVRTEAGGNTLYSTMVRLQGYLESQGVEFLDAIEGERGAGVALKWGVEPSRRSGGEDERTSRDGGNGIKALHPEVAEFWAARPAAFARLSEEGRRAISEAALGDPEALNNSAGA
jgi:transcriptional regulator with XRE-family HTH domain